MRRTGKAFRNTTIVQDPGKDFFAFLFITILIMVFVVLMTYEQKMSGMSEDTPPSVSGSTGTITVSKKSLGRLVKSNDRVLIVFDNELKYDPLNKKDIAEMIKKELIQEKKVNEKGDMKKVLKIIEDSNDSVLISEYFKSFSVISSLDIEVKFVRIQK